MRNSQQAMPEKDKQPRPAKPSKSGQKPAMPLTYASVGDELELVSISGGRRLQYRLTEMGLMPGVKFRIVSKGSPGPVIISLKDARLILGFGMAHKISVRPL